MWSVGQGEDVGGWQYDGEDSDWDCDSDTDTDTDSEKRLVSLLKQGFDLWRRKVMDMIAFKPLGIIHSPFTEREGMPIQPPGAEGIKGTVEIYAPYVEGLKDLDGFSHIFLLYHFHQSEGYDLRLVPFMDTVERGVFATRAPRRPNGIGQSVVRLCGRGGPILHIENVDILDGTPLLDIKPCVEDFIPVGERRHGWFEEARKTVEKRRSDERFN